MNNLNAGWSEIWDEGETGRMGEQVGGDKGGVKVPVYTAGGVRFQHTLQQSAIQFQSRTKVEKDTDCVLIGE